MVMTPQQAQRLEGLLREEIALHRESTELARKERGALVRNASQEALELVERREALHTRLQELHAARLELSSSIDPSKTKLSEVVRAHASAADQRRLMPLVDELRAAVQEGRGEAQRFNQLAQFGLAVANGLVSMLKSATQHVVTTYSPRGKRKELYHPNGSRRANLLKEV